MSEETRSVAALGRAVSERWVRTPPFDRGLGRRRQQIVGIGALFVAQLSDVLTTVYGLSKPGIVEVNPVAVAAMDALGTVPGLLFLMGVVLCGVVSVTEAAARYCDGTSVPPRYVRYLGYLPLTVFSLLIAAYNVTVITSV